MNIILLQIEAQAGNQWSFWVMVLIIALIIFISIYSRNSKKKRQNQERQTIQKGDMVVTNGGLYGEITEIQVDSFVVKISTGDKVRLNKDDITFVEKNTKQLVENITCHSCGKKYDSVYEFCPYCGTKQIKECPHCHKKGIPISATFCPECGTKLQ